LISGNGGVVGLHKNGDVASWESLREGGQFEEWLRSYDAAVAALGEMVEREETCEGCRFHEPIVRQYETRHECWHDPGESITRKVTREAGAVPRACAGKEAGRRYEREIHYEAVNGTGETVARFDREGRGVGRNGKEEKP
jgi:hypothetical protein